MSYSFVEILTLIGSLGLFLFGMKMMSESLQKVAGNKMRSILGKMTSNRIKGVLTGFLVTTTIQSSSATTVMLVSFVNAGLITLVGSIGVIMGANIGTTVTGWLVSVLGFKISIASIALPIIGLSMPFVFSKKKKTKFWGEFLIGFAILFMGLGFLKSSVPDLKLSKEFATTYSEYFDLDSDKLTIEIDKLKDNPEQIQNRIKQKNPELEIGSEEFDKIQSKVEKQLEEDTEVLVQKISVINLISGFKGEGIGSILLFLLIGTLLTIIIQSSSATMALTIVMAYNGIIPFELAAAMILGENIGTTITANLAALVANTSAKRTALAHLIFNVLGVIWVLFVFKYFLQGVDMILVKGFGSSSAFTNIAAIPFALSLFHTVFNITNTVLLFGFAKQIARFVEKLIKEKDGDEEEFRLKHMSTPYSSNSELSIFQAKNEIAVYAKRGKRMFSIVKELSSETNDKKFAKLMERLEKYEEIGDNMEVEIAQYLTKVSQSELSMLGSRRVRSMFRMIDNLESIFDACYNLGRAMERKRKHNSYFSQEAREHLANLYNQVEEALDVMINNLTNDYADVDIDAALEAETKINLLRDELKKENLQNIKNKEYKYRAGVIYNDMFTILETMGDHVINVSEAVEECKE